MHVKKCSLVLKNGSIACTQRYFRHLSKCIFYTSFPILWSTLPEGLKLQNFGRAMSIAVVKIRVSTRPTGRPGRIFTFLNHVYLNFPERYGLLVQGSLPPSSLKMIENLNWGIPWSEIWFHWRPCRKLVIFNTMYWWKETHSQFSTDLRKCSWTQNST